MSRRSPCVRTVASDGIERSGRYSEMNILNTVPSDRHQRANGYDSRLSEFVPSKEFGLDECVRGEEWFGSTDEVETSRAAVECDPARFAKRRSRGVEVVGLRCVKSFAHRLTWCKRIDFDGSSALGTSFHPARWASRTRGSRTPNLDSLNRGKPSASAMSTSSTCWGSTNTI